MGVTLTGTEEISIEVPGVLPRTQAEALVGDSLRVEHAHGYTPVSLLLFQMKGLRADGVEGPGHNYGEALWRIGVMAKGEPAWFALACDVDNAVVRKGGSWLVRYPLRTGKFRFEGSQARGAVEVEAKGKKLVVVATPRLVEPPPLQPPRRLVVRHANTLWDVPWEEGAAPFRRTALIAFAAGELAEATFGPEVRWERDGLLHRGRVHRCGLAKKLE